MSRVKRLKERKRKNKIKTTYCCLALALAMGISQCIGTYALFTDNENVPSDIALSTGDVDVEVSEGIKLTDVKPGDSKDIPVKITNNGTLNQNISLVDFSISEDIKQYLTYEFIFDGITIKDGVMHSNEKLVILAPGESIEGSIRITVKEMSKEVQDKLYGKIYNLDLTVKSTQISNKENELFINGFYDVAIQRSTISIAQREIITIATGEKAHFINRNGNNYTSIYIPVYVNGLTEDNKDKIKITATVKGGQFNYDAEYVDKGENKYIKITTKENNGILEFQNTWNITINIKIGEDDEYPQLCWIKQENAANSNCQGAIDGHPDKEHTHRCQIQVVNPGHKTYNTLEEMPITEKIEPLKEEVEELSESEVVEQPKETEGLQE